MAKPALLTKEGLGLEGKAAKRPGARVWMLFGAEGDGQGDSERAFPKQPGAHLILSIEGQL